MKKDYSPIEYFDYCVEKGYKKCPRCQKWYKPTGHRSIYCGSWRRRQGCSETVHTELSRKLVKIWCLTHKDYPTNWRNKNRDKVNAYQRARAKRVKDGSI